MSRTTERFEHGYNFNDAACDSILRIFRAVCNRGTAPKNEYLPVLG